MLKQNITSAPRTNIIIPNRQQITSHPIIEKTIISIMCNQREFRITYSLYMH